MYKLNRKLSTTIRIADNFHTNSIVGEFCPIDSIKMSDFLTLINKQFAMKQASYQCGAAFAFYHGISALH
jgi:hypothetical protein